MEARSRRFEGKNIEHRVIPFPLNTKSLLKKIPYQTKNTA